MKPIEKNLDQENIRKAKVIVECSCGNKAKPILSCDGNPVKPALLIFQCEECKLNYLFQSAIHPF